MRHGVLNATSVVLLLVMDPWQVTASTAEAKPGLLIVAHGAPGKQWNAPVFEFGRKVAEEAVRGGRFRAVRTAMLEFTQPDVPGAIAQLEAQGCDRIIAVPLFIAPSGHSLFDVPAVLGIYSSPQVKALIAEEGGRVAEPRVPITLTQTLHGGDILCTFALDQLRKLSVNPAEEALVLIAHGDADHHRMIDRLMRRITTYCCGQAGIDYGDWAFVGVGQGYIEHGLTAIATASEHKKRVLVVGIYVSSSALSVHKRAMAMAKTKRSFPRVSEFFEKNDVVFSTQGLVTHPDAAGWVLSAANSALEPLAKPTPKPESEPQKTYGRAEEPR